MKLNLKKINILIILLSITSVGYPSRDEVVPIRPKPFTRMMDDNDPRLLFPDIDKMRKNFINRFGDDHQKFESNHFRKYVKNNLKNPVYFKTINKKINPTLKESSAANPIKKMLPNVGWSSDYWASCEGGISFRWRESEKGASLMETAGYPLVKLNKLTEDIIDIMSPAEKYDLYLGTKNMKGELDYLLTRYERNRTKILESIPEHPSYNETKIEGWMGLCHGWAPASQYFKAPRKVTLTGKLNHKINFYAADIQALLMHAVHLDSTNPTTLLGFRCQKGYQELTRAFEEGSISSKELLEEVNKLHCKETNAAAFHLSLTNGIDSNLKIMADVDPEKAVWNQPLIGYSSHIIETVDKQPGLMIGQYSFSHPDAVKKYLVETDLYYLVETRPDEDRSEPIEKSKKYQYWLEVDNKEEIVQGYWEDIRYQPDFLWTKPLDFSFQKTLLTYNFGNQQRILGTLDYTPLKKIYARAVADLNIKEFVKKFKLLNSVSSYLYNKARENRLNNFKKHQNIFIGTVFEQVFLSDKQRKKKRLLKAILKKSPSYLAREFERKVEYKEKLKKIKKMLNQKELEKEKELNLEGRKKVRDMIKFFENKR